MLLRFVPRVLAGLLVTLVVLLTGCSPSGPSGATGAGSSAPSWARGMATISRSGLPAEARQTLDLIDRGGPFPYRQDNTVFGNFEGRLPKEPRGYYHEYTVRTPGSRDRGARRIVTGQGGEFYYTDDHYNTFRAVLR
ncbi:MULTISPECIES: ribonuclease domain-containing protein [Streptomyces]|uniref:Ribonuclease N n=1 Tax=Streptomyces nodosus TaxID=40318 RepID=A0A0B5D908_9ACTN|nr:MULTISPECIES: ribonuclease domain-containing protein [Streptomyces]AJE39709.1 ribonuclease N [Streptomyces nodosus]MBB4790684.1 ribonuclease T1 [Streptomyces nodosus]MYV44672.1 ribonuclease N [Streptomyces sp. SID2888]QEV38302.1 ribonuclease N [Streptomyces nodosus]